MKRPISASCFQSIAQRSGRPDLRNRSISITIAAILTLVLWAGARAEEIPWEFQPSLPEFIGHAAWPHPLPPPQVPQNPFLAPNPFSIYHHDTWMSDVYTIPGPLGREPAVLTSTLSKARSTNAPAFMCGALLFDRDGRIVTVCNNWLETVIVLLDPVTLEVLAHQQLPSKITGPEAGLSTGYTILDNLNRAWVPSLNHILVVEQTGGPHNTSFNIAKDYDLSAVVKDDIIGAFLPDFSGRIWFVTRHSGIVGIFDPATDEANPVVHTCDPPLNEEIANGFAIDQDDAYIVSTKKMYRFTAGKDNTPSIVWSSEYENINETKPGQYSPGSGTTPTILDHGKYVAIGDNAEQFHVVVYRTEANLPPEKRVLCQVPVFEKGYGACENSFIGFGRSIMLENNYGYTFDDTFLSTPSEPGVARVDIAPNGKSCDLVWANLEVTTGNYGPKLSTKTGLLYVFSRKPDPRITDPTMSHDVWYWTAIDFRTGTTVYERLVGTGRLFDGYWPLAFLGPDGTGYMASWGGISAIRDPY